MKAAATLALLGLAQASHCNVDSITYTSNDCSGTGTTAMYVSMTVIGECAANKEISLKVKECTSSKMLYDYYASSKDCSGTATMVDVDSKVGTCIAKATSGSYKLVLADGAAATAVAWASVAIAMLAAHV